jgi:hypothetical protein
MTRTWEDILQSRRRAGSTNSKDKPLAWHDRCVRCGEERPRQEFRRWQGTKRLAFKVCNTCHPEKTIQEMTEGELKQWLDYQQTPDHIKEKVFAARKARIAATKTENGSQGSRTYWRSVRRDTWHIALLRIRAERTKWQAMLAPSAAPRYTEARLTFAARYTQILADLLGRIERVIKTGIDREELEVNNNKAIHTRMTLPGVEKKGELCFIEVDDPADWSVLLSDAALQELSNLWSVCTEQQIKGRPLAEPGFLRALAS